MKKFKLDRIISIATLVASLVAILLALKKPAPVAVPQAPAAVAAEARSFDQKLSQLEQASQQTPTSSGYSGVSPSSSSQAAPGTPGPKAEVHINSEEISAVLAQSLATAGGAPALTADSNIGAAAPPIKDQQVTLDGDIVHGQFLTEIAGKDVWITIAGHIGEKDGYATFDPTEFKVGDLTIPVSLVNPALQKKLGEERDRLKLPDYVGDVKVKNGELVMQQK